MSIEHNVVADDGSVNFPRDFAGDDPIADIVQHRLGITRKRIEVAPAAVGGDIKYVLSLERKDTPGDVLLAPRQFIKAACQNRRRIAIFWVMDPDVTVARTGIATSEAICHCMLLTFARDDVVKLPLRRIMRHNRHFQSRSASVLAWPPRIHSAAAE